MKQLILFLWLVSCQLLVAQVSVVQEKKDLTWNSTEHRSFKNNLFDSLVFPKSDSNNRIWLRVSPDLLAAYQQEKSVLRTGIQLQTMGSVSSKLRWNIHYLGGYTNSITQASQGLVQPNAFFVNQLDAENRLYHDVRGRVSFTPSSWAELQAGMDVHHLGEGDRSLFLDKHATSNPFASAKVKFWKLEYHLIQQLWKENIQTKNAPKGNVSHYLSFKPTKKWSFGIFETVVYNPKDTLYNRGFELEYLNPMIFYRPQEYGIGSMDNVLLGAQAVYQGKNYKLYTQFILDDFVLGEIRARSRWWANKYAVQLGFKGTKNFAGGDLFYRSELNVVRPFTYTQVNPGAVYGNVSLPIAHPLGANFAEFFQQVAWRKDKWQLEAWFQFYLKGRDSLESVFTYGGDLYQPYNNRPTGVEYGYKIGAGDAYRQVQLGIQLAYFLPELDWQLFIEPRAIIQNSNHIYTTNIAITLGVQRSISPYFRNY